MWQFWQLSCATTLGHCQLVVVVLLTWPRNVQIKRTRRLIVDVQEARLASREFVPNHAQTSIPTIGQKHDILIGRAILIQPGVSPDAEPRITGLAECRRTIAQARIVGLPFSCLLWRQGDAILGHRHQHRIRA